MILAIYGSGGSGRDLFETAQLANARHGHWSGFVFVDDMAAEKELRGCPVFSFESASSRYAAGTLAFAISLGEPAHRQMLCDRVEKAGYTLARVIHPDAAISPSATVGDGLIAKKGAVVCADVVMGKNIALQHHAIVGHGVHMGNHCQVSSLSDIAGECTVGSQVFFGLNTVVKEKTTIGDWAVVGMGSCVLADIPEGGVVMGNPARLIKKNTERRVFT